MRILNCGRKYGKERFTHCFRNLFSACALQVDPLLELHHSLGMVIVEVPWVDAVDTCWNDEWYWIGRDDECGSRFYYNVDCVGFVVLLGSCKSLLLSCMGLKSNFHSARPSVLPGFRNAIPIWFLEACYLGRSIILYGEDTESDRVIVDMMQLWCHW